MKKYLEIKEAENTRAIYNLAIAVGVRMIPLGNGAKIEIIYDIENEKKNLEIHYNFTDDGKEALYEDHKFKITSLLQGNRDFGTIFFP